MSSTIKRSLSALRDEVAGRPAPPEPPSPSSSTAAPTSSAGGAAAVLGYVLAVFIPVLALIPAIILAVRGEWGHVVGIILAVIVSIYLHAVLIGGGV